MVDNLEVPSVSTPKVGTGNIEDVINHSSPDENNPIKGDDFNQKLFAVTLNELSNAIPYKVNNDSLDTIVLLTSLPSEEIYIYGYNDDTISGRGLIIQIGLELIHLDEYYLTPRQILPLIDYSDYDKDGENELAITIYWASGTGVSIEKLYVIDTDDTGTLIPNCFLPDDYKSQIATKLNYKYDETENELIVFDGTIVLFHNDLSWNMDAKVKNIYYGDIIHFRIEDELELQFLPGLQMDNQIPPVYEGMNALATNVIYNQDGTFTISNLDVLKEQ